MEYFDKEACKDLFGEVINDEEIIEFDEDDPKFFDLPTSRRNILIKLYKAFYGEAHSEYYQYHLMSNEVLERKLNPLILFLAQPHIKILIYDKEIQKYREEIIKGIKALNLSPDEPYDIKTIEKALSEIYEKFNNLKKKSKISECVSLSSGNN